MFVLQCFLANPAMLGKLFLKLWRICFWPDKNKISLFFTNYLPNTYYELYNKTYYKISVSLIYLTLFKEKRIKTDKTKQTFIMFKIDYCKKYQIDLSIFLTMVDNWQRFLVEVTKTTRFLAFRIYSSTSICTGIYCHPVFCFFCSILPVVY